MNFWLADSDDEQADDQRTEPPTPVAASPLPSAAQLSNDPTDVLGLQVLVSSLRRQLDGLVTVDRGLEVSEAHAKSEYLVLQDQCDRFIEEAEVAMESVRAEGAALVADRDRKIRDLEQQLGDMSALCRRLGDKLDK